MDSRAVGVTVKGGMVNGTVASIRGNAGVRFAEVLAALSPEARRIVEGPVDAQGWYPLEAVTQLMEANLALIDGGDEAPGRKRSEEVVARQLEAGRGFPVRVNAPDQLIHKLALVHLAYFNGVAVEVAPVAAGQVRIRYTGFARSHRLMGNTIVSYFKKSLEFAGGERVQAEWLTPISAGKPTADLLLTWSLPPRTTGPAIEG